MESLPKIIQGGMDVAISNWKLAKSVSMLGQESEIVHGRIQKGACRILWGIGRTFPSNAT